MSEHEATIVWWQFSDIHWRAGPSEERARYLEILFEHLERKTLETHGVPSFIAITGDLSFSGKHAEYDAFRLYFVERLTALLVRSAASAPPIFIVPGNHDVDRDATRRINPDLVNGITTVSQLDELFQNDEDVDTLLRPFRAFSDFHATLNTAGIDPKPSLSWGVSLDIGGRTILVAGANTAWASGFNLTETHKVDDLRHLWLGLPQLTRVAKASSKPDLSVLLLHHPLSWLSSVAEAQSKHHIQKHFDVLLTGHVHTADELAQHITPNGKCLYLPTPVLHDRADTDRIKYARGYAVVVLDLETRKGAAYYFKYSEGLGARITPFLELYHEDSDHFPLDLLRDQPELEPEQELLAESVAEMVQADGDLRRLDDVLGNMADAACLSDHTVAVFDALILDLLRRLGVLERDTAAAATEAMFLCRAGIIFQVQELRRMKDNYQAHRAAAAFRHFLESARRLQPPPTLKLPLATHEELTPWSLDTPQLRSSESKQLPEFYLRYYAFCWLIGQVCFYMNNPIAATAVFSSDLRVKGVRPSVDSTPDHNLLSARFDPISGQILLDLRVADRDGFLLVSTIKHFVDAFIRELTDLWRRHQRVFPSLAVTLYYPQWKSRGIHGEYLTVEATPIIRLLMGKGLYRDTEHVWFRELMQNALDANSTRRALSGEGFASRITIRLLAPNVCSIRDNGIGMSYQHITRYLTTLGRSIWASDELDEGKSGRLKTNQAIGQFGIGFASVFEYADRVQVYTRFFRDIGEDGWRVDFTSVEKPFFIERHPCETGTEVQVQLKKPLTETQFAELVHKFFIYAGDALDVTPPVLLPTDLQGVQLLPPELSEHAICQEISSKHVVGSYRFSLSAAFLMNLRADRKKDAIPASYLLISNAGVRVFEQAWEYLKPGLRYILTETEQPSGQTKYEQQKNAMRHFYVVVDFEKGYSPILPSRNEIDITTEFSAKLQNILHEAFMSALRRTVTQLAAVKGDDKARREQILTCLIESNDAIPNCYRSRRGSRWQPGSSFPAMYGEIQALYRKNCPICIQTSEGDIRYLLIDALGGTLRLFALKHMTETSLFRVYVRAKGIREWVVAESPAEYVLLRHLLAADKWKGIREDRDIYVDRRELFSEKIDAPLTSFLRGDYALVETDIFSGAAFICLPGNLPDSWKRGECASHRRANVYQDCPARVLLNARHSLVVALNEYARDAEKMSEEQLRILRLTLDALFDGVIEQDRIGVARERWRTLREEIGRLVKIPAVAGMAYESLKG